MNEIFKYVTLLVILFSILIIAPFWAFNLYLCNKGLALDNYLVSSVIILCCTLSFYLVNAFTLTVIEFNSKRSEKNIDYCLTMGAAFSLTIISLTTYITHRYFNPSFTEFIEITFGSTFVLCFGFILKNMMKILKKGN